MSSISRAIPRNNNSSTNQMEAFKIVYLRAQKLTNQIAEIDYIISCKNMSRLELLGLCMRIGEI